MLPIDQVQLHFDPAALIALNFVLALVMFGIAIDLKVEDFREALKSPKGLLLATTGFAIASVFTIRVVAAVKTLEYSVILSVEPLTRPSLQSFPSYFYPKVKVRITLD